MPTPFKPGLTAPYVIILASITLHCSSPEKVEPAAQRKVEAALEAADAVNVIVNFRVPARAARMQDRTGHRAMIRQAREAVLAAAPGFVATRHFDHVPAVAGRASRGALDALSRVPNVSSIQLDSPGHGALSVSAPAIGADVAQMDNHVTGKGVRVAVLDSGVNTGHPDLASSIVPHQRCFTQNACPPYGSPEGTSAEDDHGHGSHVAGIITSDGAVGGVGFAPDAEIVAVKVNDQFDSGFQSDWVAGLDWVFSNLDALDVKVINMSICTNALYGSAHECDENEPALAAAIKNLVDAGVTVFAASGNQGSATHLSAPACNTGVIAVGATYKSNQGRQPESGTYSDGWGSTFADCADESTAFDQVTCFTNSGPRLDIVAPGAVIASSVLDSETDDYRGTSQASPTAAGVAALMLECNPELTPAAIQAILIETGVSVTDAKSGISYPSIRAAAAVEAACAAVGAPGGGDGGGGGETESPQAGAGSIDAGTGGAAGHPSHGGGTAGKVDSTALGGGGAERGLGAERTTNPISAGCSCQLGVRSSASKAAAPASFVLVLALAVLRWIGVGRYRMRRA